MNQRRQFLFKAPLGLLAVAGTGQLSAKGLQDTTPPGAPPVFGNAPAVGPEVSPTTFAEAEKLVQLEMTEADRQMASGSWRTLMAGLLERRTGPRKTMLAATDVPAMLWNPVQPGIVSSVYL